MDFQKQTVDPVQVSLSTLHRSRAVTELLLTVDVTEVRVLPHPPTWKCRVCVTSSACVPTVRTLSDMPSGELELLCSLKRMWLEPKIPAAMHGRSLANPLPPGDVPWEPGNCWGLGGCGTYGLVAPARWARLLSWPASWWHAHPPLTTAPLAQPRPWEGAHGLLGGAEGR